MRQRTYKIPDGGGVCEPFEPNSTPEELLRGGCLPFGSLRRDIEYIVGRLEDIAEVAHQSNKVLHVDGKPVSDISSIMGGLISRDIDLVPYDVLIITVGGEDASASLIARILKNKPYSNILLEEIDELFTDRVTTMTSDSTVDEKLRTYFLDKGWKEQKR